MYLQKTSTSVSYGSCVPKSGTASSTLNVYVTNPYGTFKPNVQSITGTAANDPFELLADGITRAYELGAQYTSATVYIYLMSANKLIGGAQDFHLVRPLAATEKPYIALNYDDQ